MFASSLAVAAAKSVDCMNSDQALACAKQVGSSLKKDAFLTALLAAEVKRLPPSWRCAEASDWHIDFLDGQPIAKTTLVCSGPEQHVNVDLAGSLQANSSGVWTARIFSFVERPGE